MSFVRSSGLAATSLVLVAAVAGCGEDDAGGLDARGEAAGMVADLRGADGSTVGRVRFHDGGDGGTRVEVDIEGLEAEPGFHGFHVHANDDPANGEGCSARADDPPDEWFRSADGHLGRQGERHGNHQGDMPSLLVDADGTATAEFVTHGLSIEDVDGTAVVVHAAPDNFGNVPTGSGDEDYTPNTDAAVSKTRDTGNAGDRIACGVVGDDSA